MNPVKQPKKKKRQASESKLLILCEGHGEQNYFQQVIAHYYPRLIHLVEVRLSDHKKAQVISKEALELQKDLKPRGTEVWCVFDRDDNKAEWLNDAHNRSGSMNIAFSNPCFEYWFYLHVKAHQAPVGKHDNMEPLLKTLPEFEHYIKPKVEHPILWEKENLSKASRHAKDRIAHFKSTNPDTPIISIDSDPITTIHHLIEALETLEQQETTTP
ncbi:MAG: RloB family protein [Candidatus Melainabacteria bacterium]|nr:RloB family protein [Candidatus Melainabacteria bacterium]